MIALCFVGLRDDGLCFVVVVYCCVVLCVVV